MLEQLSTHGDVCLCIMINSMINSMINLFHKVINVYMIYFKIAELTVGQRTNPLWSIIRKLRITASNFGIVLHAVSENRFDFCLLVGP